MNFPLPIGTLCPDGGLNVFGTSRTLRAPGEIPELSLKAKGVDIKCSPLYGCAKIHTRRHFPEETFPKVGKAFEEAFTHRKMARKNAAGMPELVTAAQGEETESESESESDEETMTAPIVSMRSDLTRKTQVKETAEQELEKSLKKMRENLEETAFRYQALVDASPKIGGGKVDMKPTFKRKIWNKTYSEIQRVAKCPVCNIEDIHPKSCVAGHIFPESHGGKTDFTNVIPICEGCNSLMADKHLYYYAWVQHRRALFC